ncbi:hypothetical protein GCM10012287_07060 [Streptomyces daqingensis]|uniref:Uncharacterized protein n=1 Tax=Streptomyces daqingensis TaxID=1472640 RepID=A0ABQ2LVA4_9ACTN|nr:hypothetical protein GCM10012287_07060 [Streptomyces daqingensis]
MLHGVRCQLGEDQQQVPQRVLGHHSPAPYEIPDGVPQLGHRRVLRGGRETPGPLGGGALARFPYRQRDRGLSARSRRMTPRAIHLPHPLSPEVFLQMYVHSARASSVGMPEA